MAPNVTSGSNDTTTLLFSNNNNNNNTIRTIDNADHIYADFQTIAITIILVLVIFITVVGNILVCVAVCLVRKLRRPCNYLLVSLAVSDLCVAVLVMPMAAFYEISGGVWIFGEIACNLWVSFDVLSCTASILNLCMISVDRYYAITKPLEYGVKRTPRRMIFCVILVWLGAACISLPPLLILGNEHTQDRATDDEDSVGGHSTEVVVTCIVCQLFGYQLYATLCSFYIPLTVMIVVYYKIFRAARKIVLDEKRAQSHLEAHCYLEISVKNGDGPPENKISSQNLSPATRGGTGNHRSSTASTNTTCSMDKTGLSRCFTSRRSNESQCPMLTVSSKPVPILKASTTPNHHTLPSHQKKPKTKTKTSDLLKGSPGANTTTSTSSSQKKLRFQLAKERKASTTLGIIMSAFTFCWLPFFVLALVRPFLNSSSTAVNTLSSLFVWLGYANSLLNPVIYATLNRDFRKPFQEILYFRCGNLNHMMREEFYHSQYGDPDHNYHLATGGVVATAVATRCHLDHHLMADDYGDEGVVEYIEADGEEVKIPEVSAAHESFL